MYVCLIEFSNDSITHFYEHTEYLVDQYANCSLKCLFPRTLSYCRWSNTSLANFKERVECLVDQYANYTVEGGEHLNGKNTLGENIADNGGLKAAFGAYQQWKQDFPRVAEGEPTLPGVNLTDNQMFFVGFAQVKENTPTNSLVMIDNHF